MSIENQGAKIYQFPPRNPGTELVPQHPEQLLSAPWMRETVEPVDTDKPGAVLTQGELITEREVRDLYERVY